MEPGVDGRWPLPSGWGTIEPFVECVDVDGSPIHLAGFAVTSPEGEIVTGSAASTAGTEAARTRGYFELLERVGLLAAAAQAGRTEHELRDEGGVVRGYAPREDVFPASAEPGRWRPARSNGVAIHATWSEACFRARAELVERDRILRSWYGECRARRVPMRDGIIPHGLARVAEWRAYDVANTARGVGADLRVVVVVGLPASDAAPLTIGFAARRNRTEAIRAAATEAIQRFGFLYGETTPTELPRLSPTPDFHQDYYLYPPSRALLESWLDGGRRCACVSCNESSRAVGDAGDEVLFIDLTPPYLAGALWLVKAISSAAEPLVFGEPAPHRSNAPAEQRVHPIA